MPPRGSWFVHLVPRWQVSLRSFRRWVLAGRCRSPGQSLWRFCHSLIPVCFLVCWDVIRWPLPCTPDTRMLCSSARAEQLWTAPSESRKQLIFPLFNLSHQFFCLNDIQVINTHALHCYQGTVQSRQFVKKRYDFQVWRLGSPLIKDYVWGL